MTSIEPAVKRHKSNMSATIQHPISPTLSIEDPIMLPIIDHKELYDSFDDFFEKEKTPEIDMSKDPLSRLFEDSGPTIISSTAGSGEDDEIEKALNQALNEITAQENTTRKRKLEDDPIMSMSKNPISISLLSPESESLSSLSSPNLTTTTMQDDSFTNKQYSNMRTNIKDLKTQLIGSSKLISTFTVLKTTYLKLCKEFNYLLEKFNNNERIKIELINENNQLKNLLAELIKERELDMKANLNRKKGIYKKVKS